MLYYDRIDISEGIDVNKISKSKINKTKINGCFFLIADDDLLEKCNTIWDKVSADIKKEFDSEPVYNKKFFKTKIKSHGDEVTKFYDKETLKVDSNNTCLTIIRFDSALNKDGNYYPQVFFKEYKYIKEKVTRHINENLCDCSFSDESDEEYIEAIMLMIFEIAILKMHIPKCQF